MRRLTGCVVGLVSLLGPGMTFGEALPAQFTLGRYIPDDVWMYLNSADNPEHAWIKEQWADVFQAFKDSGIQRDVLSLFASALSDEDRGNFQIKVERLTVLLDAVKWGDLIAREFAFAERVSAGMFPGYDYFLLVRGTPGSATNNMAALVALLEELVSWTDKVTLTQGPKGEIETWTLRLDEVKLNDVAVTLHFFRKGDILGFVAAQDAFKEVLALMEGEKGKRSIAEAPRFVQALGEVKRPEDMLTFFDIKLLLGGFGTLMTTATQKGEDHDEDDVKALAAVKKGFAVLDVVDYSITTVETDGHRQFTHATTRIQAGKIDSPAVRIFADRKPFERFDKYIPADATSFSVSGFINVEHLYDLIISFIRDDIPQGTEMIDEWNTMLTEWNFEPHRDVFSWWGGEIISVTMPAAIVTPMSSTDRVAMVRVKDSAAASQKVGAAIDWVSAFAQEKGQTLTITPATDVHAEGFRQITHPILAMFIRPVIGVKDEWLMVGSSGAAVNKCLDVAAGKAPSIVTNERFKKEGLGADGPVHSISFKDTSKFGQELAGIVGMVGMFGGLASAQIPDEGTKKIVQKIMGIIMKLGPVLQKIDFYSSEASVTVLKGDLIQYEYVITYKEPSPVRKEKRAAAAPQE
ncbi:MAG: hypothetical protein IID43_05275 [Planctomycetes bacterium]|nr:hypothetical protein [Planctomycetota bacterium]